MDDAVRRALEISPDAPGAARTVDITTTGAKTGRQIRIEIWFYRIGDEYYLARTPGLPRPNWLANLIANPEFLFHLKNGVQADLTAIAHPVSDPAERERVFTEVVAQLNSPSNPAGLKKPAQPVEEWVSSSPLVRIEFV